MKDKVSMLLNVVNIGAMLLAGLAFYFNNTTDIRLEVAQLRQQVAVAETKVEQETRGYYVIQSSLGDRLQRIETKIDCLFDKRMCR